VAEDHRLLDDEIADPPFVEVVDVGAAHPDGGDLHEHLVGLQLRDRHRLQLDHPGLDQQAGSHGGFGHGISIRDMFTRVLRNSTWKSRNNGCPSFGPQSEHWQPQRR
jgi:hypothetical protein